MTARRTRSAMTDARLPITDHLAELRTRIIRILLAWVVGGVVAWNFSEQIFGFLLEPAVAALGGGERTLQAIAPTEIFFTYLKCAVLAGFVFALPVIFWQIWAFVSPGLYTGEKKTLVPFVLVSCVLFVGGATFGYTQVFPLMFNFFTGFDSDFVKSAWTMREVFALTTRLFLAFGVAFELPVVVFFLSLAGLVDAPTLLRGTPYAVLGVFVSAAILTPPDWVSQIFLGIPMVLLYLVGVGVAYLFGGARKTERARDAA
jgi:sec-independent protein translocase protein TatC